MTFKFKAVIYSVMTEDSLTQEFTAKNIVEADHEAYRRSCATGCEEGNYKLYIELGGNWIDTMLVVMAAEGLGGDEGKED